MRWIPASVWRMRLRFRLVPSVIVFAVLAACSGQMSGPPAGATTAQVEPAGELQQFELDDQGEPRRYDVYAPPGADGGTPLPVVVVLPGSNMQPETMRALTGFDLLADSNTFLVAYVAAGAGGLDSKLCCGGLDRDVDFVRSAVTAMSGQWAVDPDRVFATGFSVGAAMAFKLAVRAPDLFAAVAPVSGGFYPDPRVDAPEAVVPLAAPAVIAFTGSVDPDSDGIVAGVDLWRLGADCAAPTESDVQGTQGAARSITECTDGGAVELYTVAGMGHSWPGGGQDAAFADGDSGLVATELIWDFFAAHQHR